MLKPAVLGLCASFCLCTLVAAHQAGTTQPKPGEVTLKPEGKWISPK